MVFSHQLQLAASFILLGLLADGLDGIVARRMGMGQMGEYLESIADMISLSVAPLILLYATYNETVVSQMPLQLLLSAVIIFSLICSLIRLSSFSSMKDKQFFIGLPTSASAIFLVLTSFLKIEIFYIIPFIILFALAMISPIHFPKLGLKMDLVAAAFIVVTIILDSMYNNIGPWLFLIILAVYIITGPLYLRRKKTFS
jgi:CDP-diacylglycerol--serine O-phosphatidyltransferase